MTTTKVKPPLLNKQLRPKEGQIHNDDISDVPDDDLLLQWAREQFVITSADALRAADAAAVNDGTINDGPQPAQEAVQPGSPADPPDDDDQGAPLVATSQVARARIARLTSAAAPAAGAATVTQFQTWRERAVDITPVPSPINSDGTPNKIGMAHISKGEGLEEPMALP